MQQELISVSPDILVGEVAKIKVAGFRLVTISCVDRDGSDAHLFYHFDKNLTMKHLSLTAPSDSPIPSISSVYWAAFLVENEIQDLFGIRFDGLAPDYERTLYLDQEVKGIPFRKQTAEKSDRE